MDKNKSIDHQLRATWQAVAKLYNERAAKHDSTMATAFVLLNIDYEKGTPSTALGPLMGMEPTSLSRTLKQWKIREQYLEKKTLVMAEVLLLNLLTLERRCVKSQENPLLFLMTLSRNIHHPKN